MKHRMVAPASLTLLPRRVQVEWFLGVGWGKDDSLNFSLRHEVARLIVWHVVTRPVVPSAVSYADVRLRRASSMEECRKTSGIQVPDEPLELCSIDHSMG